MSTDLQLGAIEIMEGYCERWTIEETFGWAKGRLGLEDPNNRTPGAVERTAPMALWAYSLTICWYAQWVKKRSVLPLQFAPWYRGATAGCRRVWMTDADLGDA